MPKPYENRYCDSCKMTAKHANQDASCTCMRCGRVKALRISVRRAAAEGAPSAVA